MNTSIQFMVSVFALTVTVTEILDMTAGAELTMRDGRSRILERGQEIEEDNNPPKISIPRPMTYPLIQRRNPDYTNTNQPLNYPGRAYYDHLGTGVRTPTQIGVTPLAREVSDGRLFGEPGYLESSPRPRPDIQSRLREPSNEDERRGIEQPLSIQQPIPYTNHNQRSPPPPLVSRNNQVDLPYSIPHVRPQPQQQFPNSPLSDCDCGNRDREGNNGQGYLQSPAHKDRNHGFNSAHLRQEGVIQEVPPPFPYYLGWGREREYLRLRGRDFDRPDGPGPDRSDYYRRTVPVPQIYDRG